MDFTRRDELITFLNDQGRNSMVECCSFMEGYANGDRWYMDETHGFANVIPNGSLTLSCEDGWLVARDVGLEFMLANVMGVPGPIEHSASEQCVLDTLNDCEWA